MKFKQIESGTYSFYKEHSRSLHIRHCLYALSEEGVPYKYVLKLKKWIPLDEIDPYYRITEEDQKD
jgi:hypothetical protein